jgi:hypothetical protein
VLRQSGGLHLVGDPDDEVALHLDQDDRAEPQDRVLLVFHAAGRPSIVGDRLVSDR